MNQTLINKALTSNLLSTEAKEALFKLHHPQEAQLLRIFKLVYSRIEPAGSDIDRLAHASVISGDEICDYYLKEIFNVRTRVRYHDLNNLEFLLTTNWQKDWFSDVNSVDDALALCHTKLKGAAKLRRATAEKWWNNLTPIEFQLAIVCHIFSKLNT